MKTTFITLGSFTVNCERIWCSDSGSSKSKVELPAENGLWNIHVLRTNASSSFFGQRNITLALSFQDFPYDVKQCLSNFYLGENTIDDKSWGVIKDTLPVDSGSADFCAQKLFDNIGYPNINDELHVSWGETGLRMNTGYGDGNYDIYTFVKQENDFIFPMLIIVDFMIFNDDIIVE